MEYKIKQIITHVQFITGSFGNVSRKGGQALSPHGEETCKDLTPFAVHLRKIYNHLRQQLKL